MAGMTAVPLQDFIASLDDTCLPRILQVCSGVYFEGSVYEISGNEVCFSTGDLIKVIGIELVSVHCEDIRSNEKFELPITHKGLFKEVPNEVPCGTIEELLSVRPVGLDSYLPFTFISRTKMILHDFTVGAETPMTVLSVKRNEGEEHQVQCCVQGQQSANVDIPLSTKGEFVECEREECYTLQEIISLPHLKSRKFCFANTIKCARTLVFTPVFQIHAITNTRKNDMQFFSSLEMDVIDVTDQSTDVEVVSYLSLTELLSQPDEHFPAVVKIFEGPESHSLFKCSWLSQLTTNQHLVLHKKENSPMVLLSSLKSRRAQRRFLVLQQYNGQFRKQPREFHSVYELYLASLNAPGLTVTVTQCCDEDDKQGLPDLSVGEQLVVGHYEQMEMPYDGATGQNQSVEVLWCHRIQVLDDDDDDEEKGEDVDATPIEKEKIFLPLYMQVHFVEAFRDTKKYRLKDLGKECSLPQDVKVVTKDKRLESDPLFGLPCLRIEGAMLEPTILASFPHKPESCFWIPPRWLSMSVSFTNDPLPWPEGQPPKCHVENVKEVTDKFYFELVKQDRRESSTPPPRPPKRLQSSEKQPSKASKKSGQANNSKHQADQSVPTEKFSHLSLTADFNDETLPVLPDRHLKVKIQTVNSLPNTYTEIRQSSRNAPPSNATADLASDDDGYEKIDYVAAMIRSTQEHAIFCKTTPLLSRMRKKH
ncbi:protein THEMIS2 [Gouania willdenowi]|uniref:protein THEMIS2 n=1 Tax=Gouania willdenowi TaxID=441366 RepID=UPI0010553AD7|nr:protein THEMIS2 [Gouania willdenowi]